MTHASTFSGIGAPEIAAEMLGWDNLFHCEINPFGRAVLDYYFPNAKSYEDITKTDFSEWRGKINVLTGGFPCQPFSYAGKRRGSKDDRYLWPYMLRCIEQVQPDWFIGENVAGITTMVFPSDDVKVGSHSDLFRENYNTYKRREPYVLDEICKGLERAGYSVQPILIPACAVGAPHRRDRVWIIAHRDITTDTGNERCEQTGIEGAVEAETPSQREQNHIKRNEELLPENRWRAFPTVSPVYRGNDGLPFDVDDITIPYLKRKKKKDHFNTWKKESLKAYGNAIVVQVIYEIFRAIEELEKN